jgi:hypothetical protein
MLKTSSIAKPTNASFASRCIRVVYDQLRSRSSASSLINFSRMRVFQHFGAVDVGTYKISRAGRCVRRISVGGIHPGRRRMARSSQSTQIDSPERGHDRFAGYSPAKRGRACASPVSPACRSRQARDSPAGFLESWRASLFQICCPRLRDASTTEMRNVALRLLRCIFFGVCDE